MRLLLFATLLAGTMSATAQAPAILAEAEQFADTGGWSLDQQFMDLMGSPYLLAHGIGIPVADAHTEIAVPEAGDYTVWVRTFNWVAPWGIAETPGVFTLLVNGTPLATPFGTEGAQWQWQRGGTVTLPQGSVTLALHDCTGFEGRCDAILFARDAAFVPPNTEPELTQLRQRLGVLPVDTLEAGPFDLAVVGGGIAGVCAALSASRLGVSVALIQDRPVLGGNNSSEVRVWLSGQINFPPYPRVGDIVRELDPYTTECPGPPAMYGDDLKLRLVQAEPNITLILDNRVVAAETADGAITAAIARDIRSGQRTRIKATLFADCTGDGCLGALAGADFEETREGHMGPSNLWRVEDTGQPAPFPRCRWAHDLGGRPFPDELEKLGRWFWETGFDLDSIADAERIRDNNLRAMYGAWDAIKNARGKYPTHQIVWAAYVAGKRESRRLLGDVVLTGDDLLKDNAYDDGCVPTSWTMDLHLADPRYTSDLGKDAFISEAKFTKYPRPYWVPYRCLYSRNVGNLFMAGRDISVDHPALGAVRVMRTGGMMGEVVGMAAALCKRHGLTPRGVYENALDELFGLMRTGVGKLPWALTMPPPGMDGLGNNIAPVATVSASGERDQDKQPLTLVYDGDTARFDNAKRWLSDGALPAWVELAWDTPRTIAAVRIVSGYFNPLRGCAKPEEYKAAPEDMGAVSDPLTAFELRYFDGNAWRPVPGAAVAKNAATDWAARFAPVTTQRLRLVIAETPGNVARIWDIGCYPPETGK